ncbi:MAG: DUF1993 family protein [Oligoflexales bacterium]
MFYELVVTQPKKMLQNLSAIMDKGQKQAETKKFDMEVLLNSRLAPDQFNLTRQIQIACDTVKFGAARLAGKDAPAHEDKEKTLPDLKARIDSVIQYLDTFQRDDFDNAVSRRVTTPRWDGKYMLGEEYALQHVVPNTYFHITTAYSILRHNGVDVGKKDFLGELPYKK